MKCTDVHIRVYFLSAFSVRVKSSTSAAHSPIILKAWSNQPSQNSLPNSRIGAKTSQQGAWNVLLCQQGRKWSKLDRCEKRKVLFPAWEQAELKYPTSYLYKQTLNVGFSFPQLLPLINMRYCYLSRNSTGINWGRGFGWTILNTKNNPMMHKLTYVNLSSCCILFGHNYYPGHLTVTILNLNH